MMAAQALIDSFKLIRHPEGGYFREVYRSGAEPMQSQGKTDTEGRLVAVKGIQGDSRNEMTSIYWMATDEFPTCIMGENMRTHVHYYHGGGPFTYHMLHPSGIIETVTMGPDPLQGHVMQLVVPGGVYKCGCIDTPGDGAYFLVGEGVAPGFDFRDFKLTSYDECVSRVGKDKAAEFVKFLHDKPELSERGHFDEFYTNKSNQE